MVLPAKSHGVHLATPSSPDGSHQEVSATQKAGVERQPQLTFKYLPLFTGVDASLPQGHSRLHFPSSLTSFP